jgi:acyl-ACP thioesterase
MDGVWGCFPMGGPWMTFTLFEHYNFTRDKEYLEEKAYPIMKSSAQFVLDFLIKDSEGNVIGRAASEWMLIDLSTRRIVQIPQAVFDAANTEREPVLGEEPFTAKLRFPNSEAKDAGTFKACNFHIDLNGHVNNVHYVSWLLEPLGEKRPCGIELLFRGETVCGETVSVKTALDAGQAYHAIFSEIGKESVVAKISIAP